MSDPDDRTLVASLLAHRDEFAFRTLYRRHTAVMYGLAVRLLGAANAEDAVQDAWIRAVERLAAFRWESALRTWLAGIVVNCCRERLRHDWRWLDQSAAMDVVTAADAPVELTVDLERAIARLPSGARSVLVLHDVEGHTHEEIGILLQIQPGTSKSQLSHARRQLRAWLR